MIGKKLKTSLNVLDLKLQKTGQYFKWYNPEHWKLVDKDKIDKKRYSNGPDAGFDTIEFTQSEDLIPLDDVAAAFVNQLPEDQRDIFDIWKRFSRFSASDKKRGFGRTTNYTK